MKKNIILLCIATMSVFNACSGGLEPPPPATTLSGTIRYVSGLQSWPHKDSVLNIRAVAFKKFPPVDIVSEVLSQNAYYTPSTLDLSVSLPKFVDSASFMIELPVIPPERLEYIAIAMLVNSNVLLPSSWRVIGMYAQPGNPKLPASLTITPGINHHVVIDVNFYQLPPQPF